MIGLIGGYNLENILSEKKWRSVKTAFGNPSSKIATGEIAGKKIALILRHGEKHSIPPHKINHQANIRALSDLGVEYIVCTAAVGIINSKIKLGGFILPDDFIDFSFQPVTFFDKFEKEPRHAFMGNPYSRQLRGAIADAAKKLKIKIQDGGVYANTSGPRFETQAELKMIKKLGGDMVGMTNIPEIILANELKLKIATIAQGVNPTIAAKAADFENFSAVIDAKTKQLYSLINETIKILP
jgi:5'-methylthioadenosine phosphorylase